MEEKTNITMDVFFSSLSDLLAKLKQKETGEY
jgi:hypothetical protein